MILLIAMNISYTYTPRYFIHPQIHPDKGSPPYQIVCFFNIVQTALVKDDWLVKS